MKDKKVYGSEVKGNTNVLVGLLDCGMLIPVVGFVYPDQGG